MRVIMRQELRKPSLSITHGHHANALGNESTVCACMNLIRAEYVEMPGLSLTEPQVERLWSLTSDLAETLLEELERVHFLRLTKKGTYVRADLDG